MTQLTARGGEVQVKIAVEVMAEIEGYMAKVEQGLREALADAEVQTGEVTTHLLDSGGKRIRPILAILSTQAVGGDVDRILPLATASELVHMSTLIHDDIIDDAGTRRGRNTVNSKWGNHIAVLTGDFLLARALLVLVEYSDVDLIRVMSDMIARMCEGEIAQNRNYFNLNQTEADYFERIKRKTALFFSACCRGAGMTAGAPANQTEALAEYGLNIGMAFQIVDDLLDILGDPRSTGKPAGSDLAAGVLTLPIIHLISDPKWRARIEQMIVEGNGRFTGSSTKEIIRILKETDSIGYAQERAAEFAAIAKDRLSELPPSRSRDLLAQLADFLIQRDY